MAQSKKRVAKKKHCFCVMDPSEEQVKYRVAESGCFRTASAAKNAAKRVVRSLIKQHGDYYDSYSFPTRFYSTTREKKRMCR